MSTEANEKKEFGIKESLELMAAIELGSTGIIDIVKDGIGADDLEKAYALVKKADVFVEGFKGLELVDDEMKDLNEQELVQLGLATYGMVKKIVSSLKKPVVA